MVFNSATGALEPTVDLDAQDLGEISLGAMAWQIHRGSIGLSW